MLMIRLFILICYLFSGVSTTDMTQDNIYKYCRYATEVIVYNEDNKASYKADTEEYLNIIEATEKMCENCHEMPAYGVSLDNDTRSALKTGLWVEFIFNKTTSHNGMPFDSLLVQVNAEDSGFNLIRKHNGLYEGRCFYINLTTDMSPLANAITQ